MAYRPKRRTNRFKIGDKVRITVPDGEYLPGGWTDGVQSMISIGTIIAVEGQGVRINFPNCSRFYTEAWCIEKVIEDNEGLLPLLPSVFDSILDGEHMFPITK